MRRNYKVSSGVLPQGYAECEYLESTGTQYIDIGCPVDTSIDEMEFTARYIGGDEPSTLFGIVEEIRRSIEGTFIYVGYIIFNKTIEPNRYRLIAINGDNFAYINDSDFHHYTLDFDCLKKDGEFFIDVNNHWSFRNNFYILGANDKYANSVRYSGGWQLKNIRISEKRNFKAALRLSDNKPGMYDLCESICPLTGTPFYVNAGTGEFLYQLK